MGTLDEGKNYDPRVADGIRRAIALDEQGQTSEAVALLIPLAEEFPNAAGVHGYLASYLFYCRRMDEAVAHARRAVQLSPGSEIASVVCFHVLQGAGRREEAHAEMKRYLATRWSDAYEQILKEQSSLKKSQ